MLFKLDSMRSEIESSLWRDLLDRWFPLCIDPKGGYHQSFGWDFSSLEDPSRALVFQSRMVWVCASVASTRPEYADHAQHGIRFLRDRMTSGLTWALDAEGAPTTDERHAYGIAFAIYGLAAAARHLNDEEALHMAKAAFEFLEAHHYDRQHGGYFEATDAQGIPKLEGQGTDSIGTPYGQKSQNTHLHLLEAFTELYRAWPDPKVRERLQELLGLFCDQLFTEPGHLTLFVTQDWKPISNETSYGHDVEAAHLMLDAADALDDHRPIVLQKAKALVDNALALGWDEANGGLFLMGNDAGPTDRSKNWWTQAEALLGFAALWSQTQDPRYAKAMTEEWAWIRDHQIDHENGGWFEDVDRPKMPKGHAWKAAYHDGRALLFTARLLG